MQITQNFHAEVRNVCNVEGTLILNENSGPDDLARRLGELRSQMIQLPELPPAEKNLAETQIKAAEAEAAKPAPDKKTIKQHLDGAASTIGSVAGVAKSVRDLAGVLVSAGAWAMTILG